MFNKESHYGWSAALLVTSYVLLMSYVLPPEWAHSPRIIHFVHVMSFWLPSLADLRQHTPPYNPFWGMFVACYWVLSPILFFLGFRSAFFLDQKKYTKLVLATPGSFYGCVAILLVCLCVAFLRVNATDSALIWLNELSRWVPMRLSSWGVVTIVVYGTGLMAGAFVRRFNSKNGRINMWFRLRKT